MDNPFCVGKYIQNVLLPSLFFSSKMVSPDCNALFPFVEKEYRIKKEDRGIYGHRKTIINYFLFTKKESQYNVLSNEHCYKSQ